MNFWFFIFILLFAGFALGELDHALMVFQIRESMGFAPVAAMHMGTIIDWLSNVLIATAIAIVVIRLEQRRER